MISPTYRKAQHAMNETNLINKFSFYFSRKKRKGPVTLSDLGRGGLRIWRTHSQMTSHSPCSSHTKDLEGEECPTFYGLAKERQFPNQSSQSYSIYLYLLKKNIHGEKMVHGVINWKLTAIFLTMTPKILLAGCCQKKITNVVNIRSLTIIEHPVPCKMEFHYLT